MKAQAKQFKLQSKRFWKLLIQDQQIFFLTSLNYTYVRYKGTKALLARWCLQAQ